MKTNYLQMFYNVRVCAQDALEKGYGAMHIREPLKYHQGAPHSCGVRSRWKLHHHASSFKLWSLFSEHD